MANWSLPGTAGKDDPAICRNLTLGVQKASCFTQESFKMRFLLEYIKQSWHIVITPFTSQHVVLIPQLSNLHSLQWEANGNLLVTQKLQAAQFVLGFPLSKMFQPELQMKRRIWVELSLVFLNLDLLRITQNSPRSRNKNKDREGPLEPLRIWTSSFLRI